MRRIVTLSVESQVEHYKLNQTTAIFSEEVLIFNLIH